MVRNQFPFPAFLVLLAALVISPRAHAQQPRIGLRNLANNKVGFWNRFGCAITAADLKNSDGVYPSVVAGDFSMIEPENDLKPAAIWTDNPDPSQWNWGGADFILGQPNQTGWAQQNNVAVRGHTLVYAGDGNYRIPDWLVAKESTLTSADAKALLQKYVTAVVTRYRGKIVAWDVVNECVTGDTNNGRWFNMVNDFWYRKLGRDYVLLACQYAHQADPNVELNINDFGIEKTGSKIDNLVALVTWLRSSNNFDGTPIKVGIGMQYHLSVSDSISPFDENDPYVQVARRLQNAGIPFTITEMDVWIPVTDGYNNGGPGLNPQDPNDLNRQANIYRNALKLAQRFWNCQGFQIWGVTDKRSWLPSFLWSSQRVIGGAGLIFNQYYQPKPAYTALQEELGRAIPDGNYSIASRANTGQVIDLWTAGSQSGLQLYSYWGGSNQKWTALWQGDGTYRLSPVSSGSLALDTYNTLGNPGGLQPYSWWGGTNQEWVITPTTDGFFRISPRNAVWRAVGANSGNNGLGIFDYDGSTGKQWQLQPR